MNTVDSIEAFLASQTFAVVGASRDRAKYGNKVLRAYLQAGREVYPVNPHASEVEGRTAYPSLGKLPSKVEAVSIVTPPEITADIVHDALEIGVKHLWMQPGAESNAAVNAAQAGGVNVISGGPCVLVSLRFRET